MWFDGQRQPDTLYVANTSRGKDSTAMLRAIQLMGWPLDMIVSVDIWFDQDTPAELPPMVKFKDEYDRKVKDWFGVPVTRLCAQKPRSQIVQVERERARKITTRRGTDGVTQITSIGADDPASTSEQSPDSQNSKGHGVKNSNMSKLTYTDIFYRWWNQRGRIYGFAQVKGNWCTWGLKKTATTHARIQTAFNVAP